MVVMIGLSTHYADCAVSLSYRYNKDQVFPLPYRYEMHCVFSLQYKPEMHKVFALLGDNINLFEVSNISCLGMRSDRLYMENVNP